MNARRFRACRGLSLVEMSICIFVMLAMASAALLMINGFDQKMEMKVRAGLNEIASAQRSCLIDTPHLDFTNMTVAMLQPYLPGGALPSVFTESNVSGLVVGENPPRASYKGKTITATLN